MNEIPIVIDPRCPPGTVYFLDRRLMQYFVGGRLLPWYIRFRPTRWLMQRLGLWYSATLKVEELK